VQLTRRALSNPVEAYYLLAHETVHLLSPSAETARAIEEGVAETFAARLVEWQTGTKDYTRRRHHNRAYHDAHDAVLELEARVGSRAVKQLRAIQPHWEALRPDHFASLGITDERLVHRLLKPIPLNDILARRREWIIA